jgi:cytochrome b pre-mRNA-processing protein 3
MIFSLFKNDHLDDDTRTVYEAIVAQSRLPWLYRELGVPDSVTGRYYMVSLHMCLVLHGLRHTGEGPSKFSQTLFDLFFKVMDQSLREMGVGDVSVPKRIAKMGGAFYGLLAALTPRLDKADLEGLAEVLERNIFVAGAGERNETMPDAISAADPIGLARYCLIQSAALAAQDENEIMSGRISFAPTGTMTDVEGN